MAKNESKVVVASGSVPVVGLLGVVFVTLKLCGVIGWSWWWVTAPFWGPIAIWAAVLLLILALLLGAMGLDSWNAAKRHRKFVKKIEAAKRRNQ